MIDPQLQGVKWIKTKYGEDLRTVRLGTRGYLDVIERAIANGDTVLIENMEESVDPVLDPVLGRNTIKKGRRVLNVGFEALRCELSMYICFAVTLLAG